MRAAKRANAFICGRCLMGGSLTLMPVRTVMHERTVVHPAARKRAQAGEDRIIVHICPGHSRSRCPQSAAL
jgi:hypothetical protein